VADLPAGRQGFAASIELLRRNTTCGETGFWKEASEP
jgi:hypothetical protein